MSNVKHGRSEAAIALNLKSIKVVAVSWVADALLLALLAWLAGTPPGVPLLYLAIGLGYSAVTYFMIRSRYAERFADPTLSFPSLIIAVSNQCLGLWLAPEIGFFFLFNIFQVFAYGLFTLSVRQFGGLLLITLAWIVTPVLQTGHVISFPIDSTAGKVLFLISFFVCLGRFVWVGVYVGGLRDRITAKNAALADKNAALSESEARFRALTELSSDWYWEQDENYAFTRMESGTESTALPPESILGRRLWECGYRVEFPGGWEAFIELTSKHQSYRDVVISYVAQDGQEYFVSLSGGPKTSKAGAFAGYRGVAREITEKRRAENRIQYLATHDGLTGLPNRTMFTQLVASALETSRRYGRTFAVLFIDLDRFKLINDTLGHEAGDDLLKEIASRFKQELRASDIVARLGGDEFVVLLHEIPDRQHAEAVAGKLLAAAARPVPLAGQECRVSASIGIALFPTDADDVQTLLKNADGAMYLAKEEGKNNFQFYSSDMRSQAVERLSLENELRHALARGEFDVHYQAKRDLRTNAISGVEALLRWNNPKLGSVPPVQFIHVAEDTGLIIPIGKWVLRTACEQNMKWQQGGLPPICISVNLSARQFADDRLIDDISAILAETGMAPSLLELEITEGMVIHNPTRILHTLQAIKNLGVRIAIDDFGTGYLHLSRLQDLPIDTLKVDRSFIRDLGSKPEGRAITEAIISMSRSFHMDVIAEGVETEEQETFLRQNGCDHVQGFYVSKPVPQEQFASFLLTQNALLAQES